MALIQDFALINTYIQKIQKEERLENLSHAFMFFAVQSQLDLQDDDVDNSLTDTDYVKLHQESGHDRGIDAIYIDRTELSPTVHIFNCKYAIKTKTAKNNFPSSECDKISQFIGDLLNQDSNLKSTVNGILAQKVDDIWKLFETANPNFIIHVCGNHEKGLEIDERKRFELSIARHSNFTIEYHFLDEYVSRIQGKGKVLVSARIRGIDLNSFEKSDGDVRALIVDVDIRDLIRIVLDNENVRNDVDFNYEKMSEYKILEDAFEDNVRVYLKQRSRVNRNIKETALSDDNLYFFYYNNGITITCDRFTYPKTQRNPIIVLENLQVVNGSQTIHTLYEAYLQNPLKFLNTDILCRIYETRNTTLSTSIAEYTNSQNPVSTRDIRAIDLVQRKLKAEFSVMGYFYEAKRNEYSREVRAKRIDAEKVGQVLFSFYNQMPAEVKSRKKYIFGEKYEEIFNEDLTAEKVLLPYEIFDYIESKKKIKKTNLTDSHDFFILYASHYILYLIGELAATKKIELCYQNKDKLTQLYDEAALIISEIVKRESALPGNYNHSSFFNQVKLKKEIEKKIG
jgi:hypothetical protein